MRDFLALGLAGSVVVAGMAACGNDETHRRAGLGGSGTAGSAAGIGGGANGMGGTGATAAGGGGGAIGGPPAPPPDVSPQATCTGCVELIAPVVGPKSDSNVADEASY